MPRFYEPQAHVGDTRRELFIPAADFLSTGHALVDWAVVGVIERGSNGFIAADPKTGKSVAAVDLCNIPRMRNPLARHAGSEPDEDRSCIPRR